MNKSLHWLLKTTNYLQIGILATVGVLISIETVKAKPACYLLDASGRVINLSYVCEKKETPQNNTKPETKPDANKPQPEIEAVEGEKTNPLETESGGETPATNEGETGVGTENAENTPLETKPEGEGIENAGEQTPDTSTNPTENTQNPEQATTETVKKEEEEEEIDPALLSPAQRRIPTLKKQYIENQPEEE